MALTWANAGMTFGSVTTYENIAYDKIIDGMITILADNLKIPISMDSHIGNHSILLVPQEDNLLDLLAGGQSREYTILISYELTTGGNFSENTFKQLSNTAEKIKRLFAPDKNADVTGYWIAGKIESVIYERDEDEENKIRALLTFNCIHVEATS